MGEAGGTGCAHTLNSMVEVRVWRRWSVDWQYAPLRSGRRETVDVHRECWGEREHRSRQSRGSGVRHRETVLGVEDELECDRVQRHVPPSDRIKEHAGLRPLGPESQLAMIQRDMRDDSPSLRLGHEIRSRGSWNS
jgi:hypothetical protein